MPSVTITPLLGLKKPPHLNRRDFAEQHLQLPLKEHLHMKHKRKQMIIAPDDHIVKMFTISTGSHYDVSEIYSAH